MSATQTQITQVFEAYFCDVFHVFYNCFMFYAFFVEPFPSLHSPNELISGSDSPQLANDTKPYAAVHSELHAIANAVHKTGRQHVYLTDGPRHATATGHTGEYVAHGCQYGVHAVPAHAIPVAEAPNATLQFPVISPVDASNVGSFPTTHNQSLR
jgi:hypothetical protein